MKKTKGSPRVARARVHLKATSRPSEGIPREVLDAIALARRDPTLSVAEAAEFSGTDLPTIRHYAADALEVRGRRVKVKPYDQLKRKMRFLTSRGIMTVTALDSDTASVIAGYWNAVRTYVRTGNYEPLEPFILRFVNVEEGTYEFLTHRPTLNRLARAGELFFRDLYCSGGS
jgi:hypothetical protein